MKVLITGICGFAGSSIAECLPQYLGGLQIIGIDNLRRPGSESNRLRLRRMGMEVVHGDVRSASDFSTLPKTDWVIDAAANPSVVAGLNGWGASRRLFENNLAGLGNVLEYCREHGAGLLLLSSSRVYSIPALISLPLRIEDDCFHLDASQSLPCGISEAGIDSHFSTEPPLSLYGATKLCSEIMALEYGSAFQFPVWITRCGVMAGAGQFGTPDQGIFSYWINAHLRRKPLCYIGFQGTGRQSRDAFHPRDLTALLIAQIRTARSDGQRIYTAGGGRSNFMSLAQLTRWCDERFGKHRPDADLRERPYDIPWVVMDNREASRDFGWQIQTNLPAILDEIASHAALHPEWLELSGA